MATNTNKREAILGLIACYILALLCLIGGISQTRTIWSLLNSGKRAEAQVTGIDIGAKGSKRAVLTFNSDTGEIVSARDIFPMMLFRFKKGDIVTVLYQPADLKTATVDLGHWVWQQPTAFFLGFILLTTLGIFLPRIERKN